MDALDQEMMLTYFKLEAAQGERIRMTRIWHPELMKWKKKGAPPPETWSKPLRRQALAELGLDEAYYQRMIATEEASKSRLEELAQAHVLWEHFEKVRGIGPYLAGALIAASGDINRTRTVSGYWKGMGLDILPDGTVPRRTRGDTETERRIANLPHVSRVGEQLRQQMLRSSGQLRHWYEHYRDRANIALPEGPKIRQMKRAQRMTQKSFYAALWIVWREAYGLPAPQPYAFEFLFKDDQGGTGGHTLITIEDFYEPEPAAGNGHSNGRRRRNPASKPAPGSTRGAGPEINTPEEEMC